MCEYRRYSPDKEVLEVVEPDSATCNSTRRLLRPISFKDLIDFYDKKDEEINQVLSNKSRVSGDIEA